ncbi:hypothetical protein [Crossiella cryophila]|uniref:Uncharacterized protein n=1 Tax=Crossiella cryophila TaxID=43355 RepID=A0A7W7CL86_9PSEU|nr:hypothetical protein [Crossiella cryophila]MBB4681843.1 hypothetical protein [Crossiella cryophila]
MTNPDTSQYPALIQALNDSFRLAEESTKLLVDKFNAGLDNINNNPLIYLAPNFMTGLIVKVDELRGYVVKFLKAMQEFAKHHFPIVSLIQAGFDWLIMMQKPVSDMENQVQKYVDKNLHEWTGPAAKSYKEDVVSPQAKALSNAHLKADAISKWLIQVTQANIEFLSKYAEKIGELASKFVAALVTASTIVGALEALGKAGEFAGTLVKSAISVFADTAKYYGSAIGFMRDAVSIQNNLAAYPNGAWPQAVS